MYACGRGTPADVSVPTPGDGSALSGVSNPDLARGLAPWTDGLDWRRFVVVDSNVDHFLASIGYTMFVFMSASNRRAPPNDCMRATPPAWPRCPAVLRRRCAVGP